MNIFILENDATHYNSFINLYSDDCNFEQFSSFSEAESKISKRFDLFILDLNLTDYEGNHEEYEGWKMFERIRDVVGVYKPIWICTGWGKNVPVDIKTRVSKRNFSFGDSFFLKQEPSKFQNSFKNFIKESKANIDYSKYFPSIISIDKKMQDIFKVMKAATESLATVLILGESGTGKGLIADEICKNSPRKDKKYSIIDCGALKGELLESEFFGHKKGAFTGATKDRIGYFQETDGGTIFLDEIGNLPVDLQHKLLRVLQFQKFRQMGDNKEISTNVRIIAATNANLRERMKEKTFREDLFWRLNILEIQIPCLRERINDVPILANHFLNNFNTRYNRQKEIDQSAMDLFINYNWPGNVRELENTIEKCVVLEPTMPLIDKEFILTHVKDINEFFSENNSSLIVLPETIKGVKRISDTQFNYDNPNSAENRLTNNSAFKETVKQLINKDPVLGKLIALFAYCLKHYKNGVDPLQEWFERDSDRLMIDKMIEHLQIRSNEIGYNIGFPIVLAMRYLTAVSEEYGIGKNNPTKRKIFKAINIIHPAFDNGLDIAKITGEVFGHSNRKKN